MAYDPSISRNPRAGDGRNAAGALSERSAYDGGRETYSGAADERGRSAADLLRQLLADVTVLLRKELALAGSEISQSVDQAKRGAMSVATGGAVLYAGVLYLLGAVTFWLATKMPAWTAALIVGAVVTVIGAVMLQAGRKHVAASNLTPERTVDSLRKDKDAVRRQMP
ncbi:MAG TPA: phage holin family protein [Gammaproteobacteria bacterium]|nr:phage holin family protein [Gammaproteobacteria bacterium]